MRLACGTAGEIGLHVGSYHVPTGTVVAPPSEVLLRTYQVVVKGDEAVKLNDFAWGSPSFAAIRRLLVPHRGWQSHH